MIWGDVKVECHSTDDNYWTIIGQLLVFDLAEAAVLTPSARLSVPRCSALPPSPALTHVWQE